MRQANRLQRGQAEAQPKTCTGWKQAHFLRPRGASFTLHTYTSTPSIFGTIPYEIERDDTIGQAHKTTTRPTRTRPSRSIFTKMAFSTDSTERRRLMCQRAFVRNIKQMGTCTCSDGSRSSDGSERRNLAITSDIAYQMVMELQKQRQRRSEREASSCCRGKCDNTKATAASSSASSSSSKSTQPPPQHHRRVGFRHDYSLGQAVRSSADMVVESSPARAAEAVASLRKHDFAWVMRSDGSYTYAIVACFSEEHFLFLMDEEGSTKKVARKHWGKGSVRLVSYPWESYVVDDDEDEQLERRATPTKAKRSSAAVSPLYISFDSSASDDISVISDVSVPKSR